MSERKLRVGIIGIGWWSALEHVPQLRATGRVEVVAAARRNPQRLALAQRELELPAVYTDWRAMLAQETLDAVVVSTPHDAHVEPTLAALERGLHVLLEKPLATSVADAHTIWRAAEQSDRVVMMGVNRRGQPSWRAAHRVVAAGQLGQLRQITAVVSADVRVFREDIPFAPGFQAYLDGLSEMGRTYITDVVRAGAWRRDPQHMGGDMLADTGAHNLDVMLWLAGAPPVEVMAYAPPSRPAQAAIFTLQALTANGVILSMTFNDNVAITDAAEFRDAGMIAVYGDRGRLTLNGVSWGGGPAEELVLEANNERTSVPIEGETVTPAAAFVAAILDGAPNIAPVADAVNVTALTQGAYRSAAERRIVRLDESL